MNHKNIYSIVLIIFSFLLLSFSLKSVSAACTSNSECSTYNGQCTDVSSISCPGGWDEIPGGIIRVSDTSCIQSLVCNSGCIATGETAYGACVNGSCQVNSTGNYCEQSYGGCTDYTTVPCTGGTIGGGSGGFGGGSTSINGACWTTPSFVGAYPDAGTYGEKLCSAGTIYNYQEWYGWTWTCNGINGGTPANCSVAAPTPVCDPSVNGVPTATAPSPSCTLGAAGPISGSGPWTWTCSVGFVTLNSVNCSAPKLLPPPTPTGFWAGPSTCGTGQINLSWNASAGATSYTVTDGARTVYSGSGLAVSDTGLAAGSSHTYRITASNSGGTSGFASATATAPATCTAPTATIFATNGYGPDTTTPKSGTVTTYIAGPTTLTWSSSGATSCSITSSTGASGPWSGIKNVLGTQVTNILQNTIFTINCTGAGGTATDSVLVKVPLQPLSASTACNASGTQVTFTWAVPSPYSQIYINSVGPQVVGSTAVGTTGTTPIIITPGTTYNWQLYTKDNGTGTGETGSWSNPLTGSFSCSTTAGPNPDLKVTTWANWDGTGRDTPWVYTTAASVDNAYNVYPGANYQLYWADVSNADTCVLDGTISVPTTKTTRNIYSANLLTETHVLKCTGPGGTNSDSLTVTVTPPPSNLTKTSCSADGTKMTINWDLPSGYTTTYFKEAQGASNWTADTQSDDNAGTSKTITVIPGLPYHIWVATNPLGPTWAASNYIDNSSAAYVCNDTTSSPITVTLKATPAGPLTAPGATNLSWSTTGNPDSCNATGSEWSGSKAPGGGTDPQSNLSAGTHTFGIVCHKAGSPDTTDSLNVVVDAPASPSIISFYADPTSGTEPLTTTLHWTTKNVTSCSALGGGSTTWTTTTITLPSGSKTVTNIVVDTSFTLTCVNSGGESTSQTVNVSVTPANYTITVNPSIGGYVTINTTSGSDTCTTTCTKSYPKNTIITLVPVPNTTNWKFTNWTGDYIGPGIGGDNHALITLDGPKTVNALFIPRPTYIEF